MTRFTPKATREALIRTYLTSEPPPTRTSLSHKFNLTTNTVNSILQPYIGYRYAQHRRTAMTATEVQKLMKITPNTASRLEKSFREGKLNEIDIAGFGARISIERFLDTYSEVREEFIDDQSWYCVADILAVLESSRTVTQVKHQITAKLGDSEIQLIPTRDSLDRPKLAYHVTRSGFEFMLENFKSSNPSLYELRINHSLGEVSTRFPDLTIHQDFRVGAVTVDLYFERDRLAIVAPNRISEADVKWLKRLLCCRVRFYDPECLHSDRLFERFVETICVELDYRSI